MSKLLKEECPELYESMDDELTLTSEIDVDSLDFETDFTVESEPHTYFLCDDGSRLLLYSTLSSIDFDVYANRSLVSFKGKKDMQLNGFTVLKLDDTVFLYSYDDLLSKENHEPIHIFSHEIRASLGLVSL